MSGTIAVIVLSYNRPRMLREALASIRGADQVILADDGSDTFSPRDVAAEFEFPRFTILESPRVLPEARAMRPSVGRLINRALREVDCDHVAYLCDDDLLAPGWLPEAALYLDKHPASHMVMGDWLRFGDGAPLETAVPFSTHVPLPLTTGNFAHRTECTGGCGCWWDESTLAVHDAAFLHNYLRKHKTREGDIAHAGVLAGYRREHPKTMLRHTDPHSQRYLPSARELFASGSLE